MNEENGAEAALIPEKEYISGIFVAVYTVNQPWHNKILQSNDGISLSEKSGRMPHIFPYEKEPENYLLIDQIIQLDWFGVFH